MSTKSGAWACANRKSTIIGMQNIVKTDLNRDPVVIIGGGVAGLAAANLLVRKEFSVAIFEAGNKLGAAAERRPLTATFSMMASYIWQ